MIPVASLSREVIAGRLDEKNADPQLKRKLFSLLDTCEMARYATSAGEGMKEIYDQTTDVITSLENVLKS
jgi:hypothetical protein